MHSNFELNFILNIYSNEYSFIQKMSADGTEQWIKGVDITAGRHSLAVSPNEDYLAIIQKGIHQLYLIADYNLMLIEFLASTGAVHQGYKSNNKLNRLDTSILFDS